MCKRAANRAACGASAWPTVAAAQGSPQPPHRRARTQGAGVHIMPEVHSYGRRRGGTSCGGNADGNRRRNGSDHDRRTGAGGQEHGQGHSGSRGADEGARPASLHREGTTTSLCGAQTNANSIKAAQKTAAASGRRPCRPPVPGREQTGTSLRHDGGREMIEHQQQRPRTLLRVRLAVRSRPCAAASHCQDSLCAK